MTGSHSDKSLLRGLNAGTASAAEKLDRQYRGRLRAVKLLEEDGGHD
jgi:hypothetical protein